MSFWRNFGSGNHIDYPESEIFGSEGGQRSLAMVINEYNLDTYFLLYDHPSESQRYLISVVSELLGVRTEYPVFLESEGSIIVAGGPWWWYVHFGKTVTYYATYNDSTTSLQVTEVNGTGTIITSKPEGQVGWMTSVTLTSVTPPEGSEVASITANGATLAVGGSFVCTEIGINEIIVTYAKVTIKITTSYETLHTECNKNFNNLGNGAVAIQPRAYIYPENGTTVPFGQTIGIFVNTEAIYTRLVSVTVNGVEKISLLDNTSTYLEYLVPTDDTEIKAKVCADKFCFQTYGVLPKTDANDPAKKAPLYPRIPVETPGYTYPGFIPTVAEPGGGGKAGVDATNPGTDNTGNGADPRKPTIGPWIYTPPTGWVYTPPTTEPGVPPIPTEPTIWDTPEKPILIPLGIDMQDTGIPGLMEIRWRDNGNKWSAPKVINLGGVSDKDTEVVLSRLGQYNTRQWEITSVDYMPRVIAYMEEEADDLGSA